MSHSDVPNVPHHQKPKFRASTDSGDAEFAEVDCVEIDGTGVAGRVTLKSVTLPISILMWRDGFLRSARSLRIRLAACALRRANLASGDSSRAGRPRLFVIVREKHWEELSFIKLGPLRLIEDEHGRDSIYVIDDDDVGIRGSSTSAVNPETLKDRLLTPLTVRLEKPREPTTFDASRSGHLIKLVVGLIQEYGALQIMEISTLLKNLAVPSITEQRIQRYLFCAENVGWLKRVSKGSVDYFVAVATTKDAATIYSKPSAKEKNRPRRRLLIREHWQKHDAQRFKAISQVFRGTTRGHVSVR
jgi:hypothetical protein